MKNSFVRFFKEIYHDVSANKFSPNLQEHEFQVECLEPKLKAEEAKVQFSPSRDSQSRQVCLLGLEQNKSSFLALKLFLHPLKIIRTTVLFVAEREGA